MVQEWTRHGVDALGERYYSVHYIGTGPQTAFWAFSDGLRPEVVSEPTRTRPTDTASWTTGGTRTWVLGPMPDERLIYRDASGGVFYPHTDRRGSTLALSQAGQPVQTYAYDEFGRTRPSDGIGGYPYRYTGQRLDPNTGTYHYKAREYSPTLGRFLQPDPARFVDGPNLYAYVGNNPWNATDPSGMQSIPLPPGGREVSIGENQTGSRHYFMIYDAEGGFYGMSSRATGRVEEAAIAPWELFSGVSLARGLWRAGASYFSREAAEAGIREFLESGADDGAHSVYRAVTEGADGSLEVAYIGMTSNFTRRAAEQFRRLGIRIERIEGLTGLTARQARGVEQALIEHYRLSRNGGSLINRINSIARRNPIYAESVAEGTRILIRAGYAGF